MRKTRNKTNGNKMNAINTLDVPQIYVADLSAYNSGYLHGKWIDATLTAEEITSAVREIMINSTVEDAEEWAIHDYQGFEGFRIEEYSSFESVSEIANALTESDNPRVLAELHSRLGYGVEDTLKYMEENYQGEYESLEDWAYRFLEDTGALQEVPKHLENYIDFQSYGRDAEMNGDIFTVESGYKEIHVFWNN